MLLITIILVVNPLQILVKKEPQRAMKDGVKLFTKKYWSLYIYFEILERGKVNKQAGREAETQSR